MLSLRLCISSLGRSRPIASYRAFADIARFNYDRWGDPKIRSVVNRLRAYYFPRRPRKTTKLQEDTGLSLNQALDAIRSICRQNADGLGNDIIFQAKCQLVGENANGVRGVLSLAKPLNDNIKILVICPENLWEKAKMAGATYVGNDELVQDIVEDKLEFERCIATVDQMPILAKLARILGPKGLMPNVKTGTLTTNVVEAVKAALLNNPFKIDKESGLFHMAFAKTNFSESETRENLKVIMNYLQSQSKTTSDGKFVESAQLMVGSHSIQIARTEYEQTRGPKFMAALERLRAQIAARRAPSRLSTATE